MSVYQPPDLETDRDAILQQIVDDYAANGVTVPTGSPEWLRLQGVAALAADLRELLLERAQGEYDAYGTKMIRLPRIDAVPATVVVTINALDTAGHALLAGTSLSLAAEGTDRVAFLVPQDTFIDQGASAVTVTLVAGIEGEAGNTWYADPQLDTSQPWVGTITVAAPSAGGIDGETDDEYVDRLTERLEIQGDTLTVPPRFALAAKTVAGVAAALAIDLYKPGPPYATGGANTNAPGHVTVAVRNDQGLPVGSETRAIVAAFLAANTVHFLQAWVIDATYTEVTVAFQAVAQPGYDPATVNVLAIQQLADFLAPANWGIRRSGDRKTWIDKPVVRFQEISQLLRNVPGLDRWTTLTINGDVLDVTLPGPAPIPDASSTVTGTTVASS